MATREEFASLNEAIEISKETYSCPVIIDDILSALLDFLIEDSEENRDKLEEICR